MNECMTIEDIYEKSNLSDIDIHIESMISLKLINKNYASALSVLHYTIGKLLTTMVDITERQINDCKENNQNNIIKITRYIDISRAAHDDIEKKLQDFGSSVSYIENLRFTHIDYVYIPPIDSIHINYDYNTLKYMMLHGGINYNMGPCKFIAGRESKNKEELIMTQRYCTYLISKLCSGDISASVSELLQFGSCVIIKALEAKKINCQLNR